MKFYIIKTNSDKEKYCELYGPHFNEKSYKYAVDHMYKKDESGNHIKVQMINEKMLKYLLDTYDVKIENNHLYDLLYVLNMANGDFYKSSIEDEKHLILYVKDLLDDPDGYCGLVFNRWCADLNGKNINIDWKNFI